MELSVRLKAVKGIVDQGGGLAWRVKNGQTILPHSIQPARRLISDLQGGGWQANSLASTKVPGDLGLAYADCHHEGSKSPMLARHKTHLDVEDSSIRGYGRIGIWSKSNAQSYFDDLTATGEIYIPKPVEPLAETKEFEIKGDRPSWAARG